MIPILLFAQVAAAASEPVQCSLNDMPLAHCRLIDTVRPDGAHRMTFKADRAQLIVGATAGAGEIIHAGSSGQGRMGQFTIAWFPPLRNEPS